MTDPQRTPGGGTYSVPPPQAVPGWAEALDAGVLPSVPHEPPNISVLPTARSRFRHLAAAVAGAVVATIGVMLIAGNNGRLGGAGIVALLATAAAGSIVVGLLVRRWGRAVLAETRRGYSTSPFDLGRFWLRPAPGAPWTVGWIGWDFSGVWVLDADGRPRATPRPDVLAPGFYPSPRGAGTWELWTGSQWSNWVRNSPDPD